MPRRRDAPWPEHKAPRTAHCRAQRSRADYLQKILTARVYDVAVETPLELARAPVGAAGQPGAAQARGQQPVFSFKLRGAYNKMAQLRAAQLARGVICASAGNHAQGVALARASSAAAR